MNWRRAGRLGVNVVDSFESLVLGLVLGGIVGVVVVIGVVWGIGLRISDDGLLFVLGCWRWRLEWWIG